MDYFVQEKLHYINDFDDLASCLESYDNILLVCGSGLESKYGSIIYSTLKEKFPKKLIHFIDIPSGEAAKTMQIVSILWDMFAKFDLDRKSLVVSIGGGALSDSVGFAASVYKRGVYFSSIPTTLLSMVDASIGGKRAINTHFGKNQIGSFYTSKDIFINTNVLKTLPDEELMSGLCEILKMSFLEGQSIYKKIINFDFNSQDFKSIDLLDIIDLSIKYKQDIVSKDYFDSLGIRCFLNYGHTLGHAIEYIYKKEKLSHGLCVALGMDFAAHRFSSKEVMQKQLHIFQKFDIDNKILSVLAHIEEKDVDQLIEFMLNDKKANGDHINFIYLKDLGSPSILTISPIQLRASLLKYIRR